MGQDSSGPSLTGGPFHPWRIGAGLDSESVVGTMDLGLSRPFLEQRGTQRTLADASPVAIGLVRTGTDADCSRACVGSAAAAPSSWRPHRQEQQQNGSDLNDLTCF